MELKVTKLGRTIFECRTCDQTTGGFTDGQTDKPGWMLLRNIDGRNHICPACVADPESLACLEDEYPNVEIIDLKGDST